MLTPAPNHLPGAPPDSRPRRRRWTAAAVVACMLLGALAVTGHLPGLGGGDEARYTGPAPWEYTAPAWEEALGGDTGLTRARYRKLAAWADKSLTAADRADLADLAASVTRADLTGIGRDRYPGYWPPSATTGVAPAQRCRQVEVLAVSPAALPTVTRPSTVSGYAKTLVAYAGTCGPGKYTRTAPGIAYVYAEHAKAENANGWKPLRSWNVPAVPDPADDPQAAVEPAEWELKRFDECASPDQVLRDRIMVVDAFSQMCADAKAAGVTLTVEAAYRTRGEQAELFRAAVKSYGSEDEARKWVAYADDSVCTSRHCSGVALNVSPTSKAMAWLTATVGCNDGTSVAAATTCPETSTPVPQMARYGFAAPLPTIPGYLEFTLPTSDDGSDTGSLSAPNCNPVGVPVPNQVASVFRCRLAREGVVGPEQDKVVAQALVVSRCESGWNAAARAFGGRFTLGPNPADGQTYTQQGVFMISAELAAAGWVTGGPGALDDAIANINAAASLWLATRGWEQFGCATGTDGGFESGPVLPAYGGPALPDWAKLY